MTSTTTITSHITSLTGAQGTVSAGNYFHPGTIATPSWTNLNNSVLTISDTINGNSTPALSVKGQATFEGDADFKGNLTVGSINLADSLKKIEERLNLLRVDQQLEERWERLKKLGDEYRALEAECLDKELIIKILKE